MVEADRLPPSISDIYKVCEHIDIIDMLSIGIHQQPSYTVILILVGSDFGVLGHLWRSKWCQKVVVWSFRPSCQCTWPLNWREGPPLLHRHRQVASASAPLPKQSWKCAWPLNWREGPPLLHTHRQVASAFALQPMQSCQCAWPLNWREGPPLLHTHRQVASASALLPMQSASQWKRMTSFRWHINPQHTAASTPTRP